MSIFWCASATQQSAMVSNFGFTLSDFLFVIVALWLYIFFFRSSAELGRSQVCLWRWQKQEIMISNFTLFFCLKTQIPRYRWWQNKDNYINIDSFISLNCSKFRQRRSQNLQKWQFLKMLHQQQIVLHSLWRICEQLRPINMYIDIPWFSRACY